MQRPANIKSEDANSHKTSSSPAPNISKTICGIIIIVILQLLPQAAALGLVENSTCETKGELGVCKTWRNCPILEDLINRQEYSVETVERCGFTIRDELICCPTLRIQMTKEKFPQTKPEISAQNDRPAVRACDRLRSRKRAGLFTHILGGTVAKLGEFPHMVAILYSRRANNGEGPYDVLCGGSLIDERFVLTAAHCVSTDRNGIPSFVRMGVANFTDPEEMSHEVLIRIKKRHIHDECSTRHTYNDIALLELEEPVTYTEYIYPACLHTDEADPEAHKKLSVTGWGVFNNMTQDNSKVLLKASLNVVPRLECRHRFEEHGSMKGIPKGIIGTLICAEDANNVKDSCQGDSGGPLHMSLDEKLSLYSVVGVVASSIGCAGMPGLYTRVASFLDFIEGIVWPTVSPEIFNIAMNNN